MHGGQCTFEISMVSCQVDNQINRVEFKGELWTESFENHLGNDKY